DHFDIDLLWQGPVALESAFAQSLAKALTQLVLPDHCARQSGHLWQAYPQQGMDFITVSRHNPRPDARAAWFCAFRFPPEPLALPWIGRKRNDLATRREEA